MWKEHASNLIAKLTKHCLCSYKLSKVVIQTAVVSTYYGYADSILRYGVGKFM